MAIRDRFALGLLVGVLADIPKIFVTETLNHTGISHGRCSTIIGGVLMPKRRALSTSGRVLGTVVDMSVSSLMGVILVHLLSLTGREYPVAKGIAVGAAGFSVLRGVLAYIGPGKIYPEDPLSNGMLLMCSGIWGGTAGYLADKLGTPRMYDGPRSLMVDPQVYSN